MRNTYVYVALASALAAAYGVTAGPYWIADAVVLAVAASAVAFFSSTERPADQLLRLLRFTFGFSRARANRPDPSPWLTQHQRAPIPRSRIAHYVTVSRIKFTATIARESDSPFERALLSQKGWQMLSGGSLEEVTRVTPNDSNLQEAGPESSPK